MTKLCAPLACRAGGSGSPQEAQSSTRSKFSVRSLTSAGLFFDGFVFLNSTLCWPERPSKSPPRTATRIPCSSSYLVSPNPVSCNPRHNVSAAREGEPEKPSQGHLIMPEKIFRRPFRVQHRGDCRKDVPRVGAWDSLFDASGLEGDAEATTVVSSYLEPKYVPLRLLLSRVLLCRLVPRALACH